MGDYRKGFIDGNKEAMKRILELISKHKDCYFYHKVYTDKITFYELSCLAMLKKEIEEEQLKKEIIGE